MTAVQKLAAAVEALLGEVEAIRSLPERDQWRQNAAIGALHKRTLELEPEVDKLAKKAAVEDPQKRLYGPQTVTAVRQACV